MMTAANRLGLYSALRAWSAMVFRSRRQSKLTVATMFLLILRGALTKNTCPRVPERRPAGRGGSTHCSVGTRPLTPTIGPASPGVAAGVEGATVPLTAAPSLTGIDRFSVPPGRDKELGALKALAWAAVDGWDVRESIALEESCAFTVAAAQPAAVVFVSRK